MKVCKECGITKKLTEFRSVGVFTYDKCEEFYSIKDGDKKMVGKVIFYHEQSTSEFYYKNKKERTDTIRNRTNFEFNKLLYYDILPFPRTY